MKQEAKKNQLSLSLSFCQKEVMRNGLLENLTQSVRGFTHLENIHIQSSHTHTNRLYTTIWCPAALTK